MYITTYQINKPKIVQFLKFKFLTIIKLNFNGGLSYKNKLEMVRFLKFKFLIIKKIKFLWGSIL